MPASARRKRITKGMVDALRPGEIVWDSEVPRLNVRRLAHAAVYGLKYRVGGRQRWYTIGTHGTPYTVDAARRRALQLLGEIEAGRDPAAVRDTDKVAPTVTELTRRFLCEHAEAKTKARTTAEYRRLLDQFVLPAVGHLTVLDVGRSDVARLHHKLRATPYQANRTLALLSKLFSWAEQHGLRPDGSNPCRHIERFREVRRERFLSGAELARLGEVLSHAVTEGTASPWVIAAIRLLVFTGARLSEILTLQWRPSSRSAAHVDLERGVVFLPDSKTGAKFIHLNPPAMAVLAALPHLDGTPFVIPGQKSGSHLVNLQKPWRLLRAQAGLEDVRLHDLRHSFASVGAAAGLGLPIIGALLGHTQAATTQRYAHLSADPLRTANDLIGARLAAAMAGQPGPV